MNLATPDILIIISYLAAMVMMGWMLRKKARQNNEQYLMGGKRLPWYMLGLSDASDMFDISGTMWMVSLCFVYGMKSIWIPWLWPVFNQVFNMMYLAKWLRRSDANTGAEWLAGRFGTQGKGVKGSHSIVVAFAILGCLGFLAYGFIGLGKFIEMFVPWHMVEAWVPFNVSKEYVPHFYGIIFTVFATFYSIAGGMHSIVLGDLIKYVIMTIGCIAIAIIAMVHLNGKQLNVPEGWSNPFFGWNLNLDWSEIIPAANQKISADGYSLFGLLFMMMLFKGVFAASAGPAPSYDMQKILSTRSPKEASKMTGFVSIVLLPVRYLMIIGLTVLGLLYYSELNISTAAGGGVDFEKVLPAAINSFLPVGLLGLVLTGLLGAFMGTFSGTLNAAQAYIVNDVYLKYINPGASTKKIIYTNYLVGILVVVTGIVLGFFAKDVNSILQWMVSGLYGGYIAANSLKWYWWRFNANGFYYGMVTGVAGALLFSRMFTGIEFLYFFPVLFMLSIVGCLVGTYTAPPSDEAVLINFYRKVRPWGFWKPIYRKAFPNEEIENPNKRMKRDLLNVVLGIIAQCCLTLLPMYLVLSLKIPLLLTVLILLLVCFILKRTWWNKLED